VAVWENGHLRLRRWWAPEADPAAPEAELAELLADSVRLRLRADVPVGHLPLRRPGLQPRDLRG
jgi:asparagine synthetase B (glutamine-hydrolysing)